MALKKISVLSLFPEVIRDGSSYSLIQKAQEKGCIEINAIQIRDFSKDKHRSVDDVVFGGGAGMLLKVDVLTEAWRSVTKVSSSTKTRTILLSPQGSLLTQQKAKSLANDYDELILVCGHYEGVDERFIETCVDEELSIGDYVLTGGEIAALVVADAVVRLIPGVVGNEDSIRTDSLEGGLLKAPQYTRPREYEGKEVPEVLLNGNHAKIQAWQNEESLKRTEKKRPDLYAQYLRDTHGEQK